MKKIKVIATDLDGTLLDSHHEITNENILALKAAKEHGISILFATGRAPHQAAEVLKKHDFACPKICGNGSIILDEMNKVIFEEALTFEEARNVLSILTSEDLYLEFYTNNGNFAKDYSAPEYFERVVDIFARTGRLETREEVARFIKERLHGENMNFVENYDDIFKIPDLVIHKVFAIGQDTEVSEKVKKVLKKYNNLSISSSWADNIEVTSARATKGQALQRYANHFGYSLDEIMAIGDNENDLSMFFVAGVSVAMGNASEAVKSHCNLVTVSNDESGVAHAIYEFALKSRK